MVKYNVSLINIPQERNHMKSTSGKTGVLTKGDLDKIAGLLDRQFETRLAPLATKQFVKDEIRGVNSRINSLETNLKTHINQGMESVIGGMDALHDELTGKKSRPWLTRE